MRHSFGKHQKITDKVRAHYGIPADGRIALYAPTFRHDDWKGTDTWNRREEIFAEKGVEIGYFAYTKRTSSTELRSALAKLGGK